MVGSMKKIGRNDPCPCGSGEKYKRCCLQKRNKQDKLEELSPLDQEIHAAGLLSLEHSEKAIIESIEKLKHLLTRSSLSSDQKLNILANLAQAYQRRGEHKKALELLNGIKFNKKEKTTEFFQIYFKHLRAISLLALGNGEESCRLFDEVRKTLNKLKVNDRFKASNLIEAGKAYRACGYNDLARECWQQALDYFEGREEDIEHYARVKANLGFMLLSDRDETKQKEGIEIIEESSNIKRLIGDIEGLANNHCNLGLYYWSKKLYQRAIVHSRNDLQLTRRIGDLRALGSTLNNLALIYADMKQLNPARELLREAKQIGANLKDQHLVDISTQHLNTVNKIGKAAGQNKERIGVAAICACGSGKEYQQCCGQADFEPVDIPFQFGGISEDLEGIIEDTKKAGIEPSRLDFILRTTKQSGNRLAWSRIKINDGWLEMSELPDMANHHIISARILANEAQPEKDSVTKPLACVILSACALESFINQVAFFLNEVQAFPESSLHIIPPELSEDVTEFQRHTELTLKWDIIGKALGGNLWPPPNTLWSDFRNLIYIRNELVHFKIADYEKVVPPPKKVHEIFNKIPASVETRSIPHAWPVRILTPSFAEWCVDTAESMIDYLRQSYSQNRISNTG